MSIDEARDQLSEFVRAIETEEVRKSVELEYGKIPENTLRDYEATKILLREHSKLLKEVARLRTEKY